VQHAERRSADALRLSVGVFVVLGGLWTGYALARRLRPQRADEEVDRLAAERRRARTPAVAHPAPVAGAWLPSLPYVPAVAASAPVLAPGGAVPGSAPAPWSPTHCTPIGGLDTRARPDPTVAVDARLEAGLEIRVVERYGDWARVDAVNGWSAWVDGRHLR
jgi:hypothetical protein